MFDHEKYSKMTLSNYEEFLKVYWGEFKDHNALKRTKAREKFPCSVIVEGPYPVNDYADRWCWQNFGPEDCEECNNHYSEYPGCPMVLATVEYKIPRSHKGSDGKIHEWQEASRDPGKHGHEGNWTAIWLSKTGYDYGFTEYFFSTEADKDAFVKAIPLFNLGENYED